MDFQKELIDEFDREVTTTRKILSAVPDDADFAWKPHAKSYALGRLVAHVAEIPGEWAVSTLTVDKLDFDMTDYKPYSVENKTAMLEKFDKDTAEAKAALAAFDPGKWEDIWTMGAGGQVWVSDTRYHVWRIWVVSHMVHHRAQLGVDLRLLNLKLPSTYGPSADEM
jgi:uncharacterized damage-inducible protein DinB